MNKVIAEKLDAMFSEFPFMKAEPVPSEEVDEAEKTLGVVFPEPFKEFLCTFGGALVGPYPIYGLRHADPMDDELWSVIDVTTRYRSDGWPLPEDWYVISSDHSDNPICLNGNGEAWCYSHDEGQSYKISETFEEYLEKCLSEG